MEFVPPLTIVCEKHQNNTFFIIYDYLYNKSKDTAPFVRVLIILAVAFIIFMNYYIFNHSS